MATPTSSIHPHAPLTETAYDRLATIAQNNELGAGMAVALKDLEIRGAGNVLGVEQSGHVAGVGFDLYVRLVGEAVEAYRVAYRAAADGQTVTTPEEPKDVRIDLPVDAHLPPDYIASDRLRLEGYRRLAAASTDSEIAAVVDELTDRYGALPEPAQRLVAVARLRLLCRDAGITEVSAPSEATIRLSPITLLDSAQVRLKRMYPAANYRATTSTVQVPIPRAGGVGAPAPPRCRVGPDGGQPGDGTAGKAGERLEIGQRSDKRDDPRRRRCRAKR